MSRQKNTKAPYLHGGRFKSFEDQAAFIAAYNDKERFPMVDDIAAEFGIANKTARNRAQELRKAKRSGKNVERVPKRNAIRKTKYTTTTVIESLYRDEAAPAWISEAPKPQVEEISGQEHAGRRAAALSDLLHEFVQRSAYPVINPEVIKCAPVVTRRYSRAEGGYVDVDGTPRTWLSGTLEVAPVVDSRNKRYLFTGAQNDTPVHEGFWVNLKAYAEHIGAEIVVGVWTYETSWWSENNPLSRAYDERLAPHLCFGQMEIGDDFVFCGDVNILPTAKSPLQGLKSHTHGRHGVFPTSRVQLIALPSTNPNKQAVQLITTGSVTTPKLIPRLAGIKSVFHHVYGATIVEFDEDGRVFPRQINAESDGSFEDLRTRVEDGRCFMSDGVRSIVAPDLHIAKLRTQNATAVFGIDPLGVQVSTRSMLDVLNPELLFIHDGHDHEIGNHHRADDGHFAYQLAMRDRTSVQGEIERLGDFYVALQRDGLKIVNVESNHDLALNRYIKEGRHRKDGPNVKFGVQLELAMLEQEDRVAEALDAEISPPPFSLLEWALRDLYDDELDHVEWAYDGSSYLVDGIECGHHGFRGANGSKGTVNGYAGFGDKMSIGDKHSPSIFEGVYGAGVMELQHGYNRGPSGWAVTVIIQYFNGKRSLVTLQDGKWRA